MTNYQRKFWKDQRTLIPDEEKFSEVLIAALDNYLTPVRDADLLLLRSRVRSPHSLGKVLTTHDQRSNPDSI